MRPTQNREALLNPGLAGPNPVSPANGVIHRIVKLYKNRCLCKLDNITNILYNCTQLYRMFVSLAVE